MIKRIYLEITNSCNLNCPFCEAQKQHSFMSLADIERDLKQIKKICNYIYLHVLGEPTLHPQFNEILSLCDDLKLNVQLVTNGTLLYKYPNILEHPSLRKLSISIHSIDQQEINQDYFVNVNRLIKTIANQNRQYLELRFYDPKHLKGHAKKYHDFLKQTYAFKETTKLDSYLIAKHCFVYYQELFHWPNINDPVVSTEGKCHGALEMLGILNNQDVIICCLDAEGHTKIGSLNEQSLEEILHSAAYLNIYNNLLNGKLINPLCQRCTYRTRFDKA